MYTGRDSRVLLDEKYKQHRKKETSSLQTLKDRMNFQKGLSHPSQEAKYKVIYPASGSFIKAALLESHEVIDHKLYYSPVESKDEGYYLVGILNSKSITRDLRLRGNLFGIGSLRDIHTKALDYAIPEFDEQNPLHNKIAALAKIATQKARDLIKDWKNKELEKEKKKADRGNRNANEILLKPRTIQKLVLRELDEELETLDNLVRTLLNVST